MSTTAVACSPVTALLWRTSDEDYQLADRMAGEFVLAVVDEQVAHEFTSPTKANLERFFGRVLSDDEASLVQYLYLLDYT
ncbi:hypothetical protein [[Mycobacterium] holstebronense]|uniref:Uncharacterized protein n=1 Tax=[Mycobacterium] holstebronense TaxID=3064288 RepID=A0ABM9LZC4_9MYCO|nr:hypothetical protein [Mycolicibacter sp. MU0102]CAJ1507384.1 hypothetical protein MU0102_003055 [Mycolicibacter sp. MU0102]